MPFVAFDQDQPGFDAVALPTSILLPNRVSEIVLSKRKTPIK